MESDPTKTPPPADSTPAETGRQEATPPVTGSHTGSESENDREEPIVDTGDEKTRSYLLGRKLDYIDTLATVSMTWWVSSLVFCGSIFAAVWIERQNLINYKIICLLAGFISAFLLGLIAFGALISWWYLPKLSGELTVLLPKYEDGNNILSSELLIFHWLMSIGTVSFIFILLGWLIFWSTLPCRW